MINSHLKLQKYNKALGIPLVPFASDPTAQDIISQAINQFRVATLFKNFNIQTEADILLIYLYVFIAHAISNFQKDKTQELAKKRINELVRQSPKLNDRSFFYNKFLSQGNSSDNQKLQKYLNSLRQQTCIRLVKRLYENGLQSKDFKFWVGLSKRKFMNMSYVSDF